jgi:hypothetical protein
LRAACDDLARLRAAELPFRQQKGTIRVGAIRLADEEKVDQRWVCHVGHDTERSTPLNDVYCGEELDDAGAPVCPRRSGSSRATRRTCLERVRGRPVYLALAMTPAQRLKLKPHNPLTNLPLARAA